MLASVDDDVADWVTRLGLHFFGKRGRLSLHRQIPQLLRQLEKIRKKYQNEVYFDNSLGKNSYWFPMSRSREINGPKTNKMPTMAHIFIQNQTVQSSKRAAERAISSRRIHLIEANTRAS